MVRRLLITGLLALTLAVVAVPVSADDGVGDPVVAPGFLLAVEVVESNSDFLSNINLERRWGTRLMATDDDWGTVVPFLAIPGREVTFSIEVTNTGDTFTSGSENARVTEPSPGCILVEFEDKPAPWEDADEPNYVDVRFFVRPLLAPACGPSPAP